MFQMTSPCSLKARKFFMNGCVKPLGRMKPMSTSRPPCALTNFYDCTNMPPDPQHGS